MYFKPLSLVALCGMVMLIAGSASAAVVFSDDFTYPDGGLDGNGGWTNHSGTAGTLLVSGGAAVVTQDGGSGDSNSHFPGGAITTGILTASFDISVTAPGTIDDNDDDEYFAHFYPTSDGNTFRARTFVQAPVAGGDYTLAVSTFNSQGMALLPTDFSFGTVVPVSITYDIDGGTASITAGGNTVTDPIVNAGISIDAFALRQSSATYDETIVVDNLVVTHVIPEPASLALMFAGLMGVAATRRR